MQKDLWQVAEEVAKEESPPKEHSFLMVGDHRAGKTSLIQYTLMQNREDTPKSTVALEYTYARPPLGIAANREIAHVYELGGGRLLANLVSVPLSADTLAGTLIAIVLDLSHPHKAVESLLYWLQVVRDRVLDVQAHLPSRSAGKLTQRVRKKWERHEDYAHLQPMPVSVVVVGSKYDVFATHESESRKWMGRALRYFCHKNGASLFYWSSKDSQLANVLRNLFSQFAFGEAPRRYDNKDTETALAISSGMDSFKSIGQPPKSDAVDQDAAWIYAVKQVFQR